VVLRWAAMRSRARIALVVAGGCFVPAAFVWSCGLEAVGTLQRVDADIPETAVEVSLPPPGDSGPQDGGPDALDPDSTAGPCISNKGPKMVLVPSGGLDGGAFCIDSTEVTSADYIAFLAATDGGSVDAGVPKAWPAGLCAGGILSFRPSLDSGAAQNPAVGMTWCAAYAYCDWAGKRLCRAQTRDASVGEWFSACSNGGANAYAYGSTYDAAVCNTETATASATGSLPSCKSVAGAFDMSGNVSEYIDSCNAGTCYAMGGDYSSATFTRCSGEFDAPQAAGQYQSVGFRCCADKK
jgi:formylglycine-generating enzyme